jgi:phosphatidate cytidylyltransferase
MSYLDPRAGHLPTSDDRSSPADEPEPYAAYWVPGDAQSANGESTGPAWNAPTAETSTAEAEFGLTAETSTAEAEFALTAGPKVRGRRRADSKTSGRAGRNLPAAIAVGLGLGLVVLASLVFWKPAFLGVIAAASAVGIWEMARAMRITGARPPLVPLIGGGLLITGLGLAGEDAVVLGMVVTVLAAVLWRLADRPREIRRDFIASLLITVYVPFLLTFGTLLSMPDDGPQRVLVTLIAVILSDTGGYAAGVFLGKHPMAPKISPKKSWEGFAGSITAAAVGSAVLLYFLLDAPFYWGLLFGAVISVVAVMGDLAESMLKRDLGIKDMSRLLPGHGGLMDRLDSILFAVPTAYLLLTLIAPPG